VYRDALSVINYTLNKCIAAFRIKPTGRGRKEGKNERAFFLSRAACSLINRRSSPIIRERIRGVETRGENLVPRADPAISHRVEGFLRRACEKSHAWAPVDCPRRSFRQRRSGSALLTLPRWTFLAVSSDTTKRERFAILFARLVPIKNSAT